MISNFKSIKFKKINHLNYIQRNFKEPTKHHLIDPKSNPTQIGFEPSKPQPKKTMKEKDQEIQNILNDKCGGIGAVEIDLQDGEMSGLKQNVKRNMFRVI